MILRSQVWRLVRPVQSDTVPEEYGRVLGSFIDVLVLSVEAELAARTMNGRRSGDNGTKNGASVKERVRTACVVRSEHQVANKEGVNTAVKPTSTQGKGREGAGRKGQAKQRRCGLKSQHPWSGRLDKPR